MNLYVHFPFCRRKCAYCALKSRAGVSVERRAAYVARLADEVRARPERNWRTVYFGGGTPALCDIRPLFAALRETGLAPDAEFTVEGVYTNHVSVRNGQVAITESSCPGGDCMHSGWIRENGRSIICLPNRVEIRVVGGAPEENEVDAVVR